MSEALDAARALLDAGSVGRAVAVLRGLTAEDPASGEGHRLLAMALDRTGDRVGAEDELRAALRLEPGSVTAATKLASLLTARRRSEEAVAVLAPLVASPVADADFYTTLGQALKMAGRREDAVAAYRKAAQATPGSGAAMHNLAGALLDAHQFAEGETAARGALELGLQAPETFLALGRALLGKGDPDAAEAAIREAIARRPGFAAAHAELAQLIWMRTEDLAAATVAMDTQLKSGSADIPLYLARARLLEFAGDIDAAYTSLTVPLDGGSSSIALQVAAALLIMPRDAEKGLEHAETAYAMMPELGPQASALCQAYLAMGRAEDAAGLAESLCREWPLDQLPVTLAATAWRLLGDERYRRLYDYDRLVFRHTIETPEGWPDFDSYLRELAASLRRLLVFRGHPIGQSLRSGVQTGQSLVLSDDPAIKALFAALDAPVRAYIDRLRGHDDVLGARVSSGYRYASAWSVELRPGGRHVDHTHPLGWISSAFHVELPAATEDGRQGWLKFGEPGLPTSPVLGPDHFVKPRVGQLVLFPSYMWHGTVPFGGEASRLTIAFDVLPA